MLKLLLVLQCLLAFATFGSCTTHPQCGSELAICKNLPDRSAASCLVVISSKKIVRSTCTRPATTITQTTTITPSVSKVISWRTVVQSNMNTAYKTSTRNLEITATATIFATVTIPATTGTAITGTVTKTTTSTIPYRPSSCIAVRSLEKRHNIPAHCSCFLASTSLCGQTTIVITKTALAPTSTIISTKSLMTTYTSLRATTVVATQITTITITSILKQTSTTTLRSSVTATIQETKTAVADPCLNPYTVDEKLSSRSIRVGLTADSESVMDCCRSCYSNLDCVVYRFDPRQGLCEVSFTTSLQSGGCSTAQCPRGNRVSGDIGDGDGSTYGIGPCAGSFVR